MQGICERCGDEFFLPWEMGQVKECYQKFGPHWLCSPCGTAAGKFVNYYGEKSPRDIENLRLYLQSGFVSRRRHHRVYSMLMNGGYY